MDIIRDKIEHMPIEKHIELLGKLKSVGDFPYDENRSGTFFMTAGLSAEHIKVLEHYVLENSEKTEFDSKSFI
jgi:hypothetical protein